MENLLKLVRNRKPLFPQRGGWPPSRVRGTFPQRWGREKGGGLPGAVLPGGRCSLRVGAELCCIRVRAGLLAGLGNRTITFLRKNEEPPRQPRRSQNAYPRAGVRRTRSSARPHSPQNRAAQQGPPHPGPEDTLSWGCPVFRRTAPQQPSVCPAARPCPERTTAPQTLPDAPAREPRLTGEFGWEFGQYSWARGHTGERAYRRLPAHRNGTPGSGGGDCWGDKDTEIGSFPHDPQKDQVGVDFRAKDEMETLNFTNETQQGVHRTRSSLRVLPVRSYLEGRSPEPDAQGHTTHRKTGQADSLK